MAYGVIYVITCLVTHKKYVGQTIRPLKERIRKHKRGKLYIDRAIQKYGWTKETFMVEVLEECATQEQLNERERYLIAKLDCKRPKGYNLADGGDGGCTFHDENFFKIAVARQNPSQYTTLAEELISRKITYGALANHLGLRKTNLARKMRGEQGFTISQMTAIKDFLGVDISLAELFRKADGSIPNLTPVMPYYPVLAKELALRQISQYKLGKQLGLTQSSISVKMLGKVKFSVTEAKKVKAFLQVGIPVEELFRRADGSAPDLAHEPPPYVYDVLAGEMKRQGILQRELAEHLGISQSNFSNRMHGKPEFNEKEKAAVRDFLGIDMPLEELFKRRD